MNLGNFYNLMKHLYTLSEKSIYLPVLAWGETGVGKSETVYRVARDLGIDFVDLRLGQQEIGDLIGLPREETVYPCISCVETSNGSGVKRYTKRELLEHLRQSHRLEGILGSLQSMIDTANKKYQHLIDIRTVHLIPDWFPEQGTKGFLFLDELNRSHLEVRQAVFQLILDRRMHRHVLPDGWIIVSAVNPATEDYQLDDIYDKAFLARFLHIAFEPSRDEWLEYAGRIGIDWSIRTAISDDAKLLGDTSVPMPRIRPTPRTWTMLDRILPGLPPHLEHEVAAGLIGPEATTTWLRVRASTDRPVKAEEILSDYKKVRKRIKLYAGTENNRSDLLKVTFDDLARITEEPDTNLSIKEINGLVKFLLDSPKDLAYAYLKFRFIRNPKLRKELSDRDDLYKFIARINKEAGLDTNS